MMRTHHDGYAGAAGRRGLRMAVVAAILVVLTMGIGAWLWAGRPHRSDVGAYELPAQSDRRYTKGDIIAMVDDCNGRTPTAADETDAAGAIPFAVEDADAENGADDGADDNAHPPTTVTMTIPAAESAEPRKSPSFQCMAKTLFMPDATQRDLVRQAGTFDREAGAMPMTWNDLGFRGWKASDGTFHLRITWYDPAAQEG